jgi:hypothetical protein
MLGCRRRDVFFLCDLLRFNHLRYSTRSHLSGSALVAAGGTGPTCAVSAVVAFFPFVQGLLPPFL